MNYSFKALYYVILTPLSWYYYSDSPIMFPSMGGTGRIENFDTHLPNWEKPPYFDYLYVGLLGYFVEDLWEIVDESIIKGRT